MTDIRKLVSGWQQIAENEGKKQRQKEVNERKAEAANKIHRAQINRKIHRVLTDEEKVAEVAAKEKAAKDEQFAAEVNDRNRHREDMKATKFQRNNPPVQIGTRLGLPNSI